MFSNVILAFVETAKATAAQISASQSIDVPVDNTKTSLKSSLLQRKDSEPRNQTQSSSGTGSGSTAATSNPNTVNYQSSSQHHMTSSEDDSSYLALPQLNKSDFH